MNNNFAKGLSRRQMIKGAAAAGVLGSPLVAAASNRSPNSLLPKDGVDAAKLVAGKDKRLVVLVSDPAVLETPLALLNDQHLTPAKLLFVRNNQQPKRMATLEGIDQPGWDVDISAPQKKSLNSQVGKKITLSQLRDMPQTSFEMVLQCSGSGRSLFSRDAQTKGTQWGRGGMGCVKFGGVMLHEVIKKLGIEVTAKHKFMLAEGKDEALPEKEDFLHTLPSDQVLKRSLLAISMNDQPLPGIHGGPIRLMTPGVYGTMHIKWLGKLEFVSEETTNYNHVPRYRVPNSPIQPGDDYNFTLANSSYNWDMKVKTVVLHPTENSKVSAGKIKIQGVAFNDGSAPIETVLVSINQGRTWIKSALTKPDSKFAWTRFETQVTLPAGQAEIWTRAVDGLGRSQPLNGSVVWNPRGYEWNGVEKIKIEAL